MSKPKITKGDFHLVVDGNVKFKESAKLFNDSGSLVKKFPCLTVGSNGPRTDVLRGNTPPGLYRVAFVQRSQPHEDFDDVWLPYGEWFIDLFDVDGQEGIHGREGIAIHGGGSNLGGFSSDRNRKLKDRSHALQPNQPLMPTDGCIRVHNDTLEFLARLVIDVLKKKNTFHVSVIAPKIEG